MPKPEPVEALLNPSLKVSRPVAACQRCRSAKIKCDGRLPACTACERSGKASSCSGANDEFARGKERSYVAALEAASARLQKQIKDLKTATVQEVRLNDFAGSAFMGSSLGPSFPSTRNMSRSRKREASDVDDLVSDFGFLSVNATSRDFHGFTGSMSFARLLLSVSIVQELPQFDSSPLPPRYAATQLVQHYLDNIFVLLPFFSETEFMTSMNRVYQEGDNQARAYDHWFVRMVLAISAGAMSQTRGDGHHQTSLQHAAAAMEHVELVVHPGSIAGIQALLLFVQYSLVDPEHFNSWYVMGMASRIMVDLGLHQELSANARTSKQAVDLRRRVFYCVYALDRACSMSLERTFSFTDDSASDITLPSVTSTASSGPGNPADSQMFLRSLTPSLFLFDIRRVQSAFYQTTHCSSHTPWQPPVAANFQSSVLNDIASWFSTIPASLSPRHLLVFRLESLYSQLMVLAPSARLPLQDMTRTNKLLFVEYAVQYMDQMQPVVHDTSWHAFFSYVEVCRVNFLGRQFLDVMWSDFDRLLAAPGSQSPELQYQSVHDAVPRVRSTSPAENCARATVCLRTVIEILDYAQQRWGLGDLKKQFEQASAVLLGKLQNKQQELNASPRSSTASIHSQQSSAPRPPLIPHYEQHAQSVGSYESQTSLSPLYHSISQPSTREVRPKPIRDPSSGSPSGPLNLPLPLPLPPGSLPRRSYDFYGGHNQSI